MLKFFLEKVYFTQALKKNCVVESSFPIATNLNKLNTTKKDKSISNFDFTTTYVIITHVFPTKVLSKVINFAFKWKTKSCIGSSKTSIYWTSKGCGRRYFTIQTLIDAISHHKLLFYHCKPSFQKKDWISYGHRPSFILGNVLCFFFQSKFVWKLISKGSPRSYKFHGTSTFIDDLYLMIDDGDFSSSYEYIYRKQFKLKLKKQDEHAIFLHLDIKNWG